MEFVPVDSFVSYVAILVLSFFLKREMTLRDREFEEVKLKIEVLQKDSENNKSTIEHNKHIIETSFSKDIENMKNIFNKDVENIKLTMTSINLFMQEIKDSMQRNFIKIYEKLDQK